MLVNFKSIEAKGFLSIGEAKIDLSNQGMVYVTGKNNSPGNQDSNGAGKSTLFEAIMYALTGTTLRGTKDVINIYWKGYAEVILDLEVDNISYRIMRTRNHPEYGNNLKIWRDDEDISGDKLKKSEIVLTNELGQLTSSLISSVIVLGQGLPNKFTDLTPLGRKDRLEELSQSSEFVGEIKTRLSNFKDLYKDKSNQTSVDIARHEESIRITKNQIQNDINKLDELESNEDDIDTLKYELTKLQEGIEKLRNSQSNISAMRNNLNSAYTTAVSDQQIKNSQKLNESRELSRLITDMSSLENSICPTCHQPIHSGEDLENLRMTTSSRVQEIKNNAVVLDNEIENLNSNIKILSDKIAILDTNYREAQNEINTDQSRMLDIQNRITKLQDTSEELKVEIARLTDLIDTEQEKLLKLVEDHGAYDLKLGIIDYLTKKSSKEFRSFMLIGVVDYINTKLEYYSEKLFGTGNLKLVLDGNKIFIQYDNRQYENLSGGERQRADLAMQFSLRDMLINSLGFNCNLLVIDEGFDNLDTSGVNSLIEVINNMTAIDSVFTITHHTLSIPFDKTIEVVKGLDKISEVHEIL